MTIKDLRTLVDNLDEYIHIPGGIERLKKTVLHLAVSGQLVPQNASEGTGEELYEQIQAKHIVKKPLAELEDTPFDIPGSWKWLKLGNIIELKSGADLTPDKYNDSKKGVPYITGASNIEDEKVIINRWTTEPKNIAAKDDLLITCKGTIGTMAFLEVEKVHIARQIMAIKFSELLSPNFIKSVISTNIASLQEAAQSIIPGIARKDMLNLAVPLPPLTEQQRIVEKVDEIFSLIDDLNSKYKAEEAERSKFVRSSLRALSHDGNRLALDNLASTIKTKADAAELRKAILHLAVSGQLVTQDATEGTGEDLYKQIQAEKSKLPKKQKTLPEITEDEIPFTIPSNWKWAQVGDIFQIRGGKRLPAGQKLSRVPSNHIYIRVTDMRDGTIDTSDLHYVDNKSAEEISKYIITKDDLYLSIAGSIGKVGKIPDELSGSNLTENASRLTPFANGIDLDYYRLVISSEFVQEQFQDKKVQMAQPKLALFRIENSSVPLPPLAEQRRIVAKTTELLNLVTELEKHMEA